MPGSRTTEPRAQQSPHGSREHGAAALQTRGLPFPLLYLYLVTADTKLFRGGRSVVLLLPRGKAHILLPFSAGEANRGRGSRPPSRLLSSRPCAQRRAVRARWGRKGPCHPAALHHPAGGCAPCVAAPRGAGHPDAVCRAVPSDPSRSEQRPGELRFTLNLCFVPFRFIPFQISLGFHSSTKGVSPRNFSVKTQTAYWTVFKF